MTCMGSSLIKPQVVLGNILGDRSEMDFVLHSCPFVPKELVWVTNVVFALEDDGIPNLSDGRTAEKGNH